MITIFNRRKLLVENSAQEAARVTELLKIHKIPYEIKTTRSQNIMNLMIGANMATGRGYGGINSITYCYSIYVQRKDYHAAGKLMVE